MIILSLKGGLGNQLFQYSCGRSLSLKNGESLKFDITGYARTRNSDTPREYMLSKYNIDPDSQIASDAEIRSLKYPFGIISKGIRFIRAKVFRQFAIGFDPRILNLKGNIYLDGFWQTEKYFLDCENIIRRELTLKNPLGIEAVSIANQIKNSPIPTVSLHVRRGDVVRDAKTNQYYGICTPEYYSKALDRMKAELSKRKGNKAVGENSSSFNVLVFSDGIDWVKENINIPYPTTYVSDSSKIPEYEELALMSLCKHNIIANSSFSWWGAWLNRNPNKIVIAPKKWIKKGGWRHKDILPDSWIRI